MRFRYLKRWLPGRRRWWLLVTLVVAIAALAIGSRRLPEVKQLTASTLRNWMGTQPAGDAGHEGRDHGQGAPGEPGLGDSQHEHEGESAEAHAGETAEAHAGEDHADEKGACVLLRLPTTSTRRPQL
jgi:hypothetical protein